MLVLVRMAAGTRLGCDDTLPVVGPQGWLVRWALVHVHVRRRGPCLARPLDRRPRDAAARERPSLPLPTRTPRDVAGASRTRVSRATSGMTRPGADELPGHASPAASAQRHSAVR